MSSQSKLRFEPQGWVARPDCFYVLPIAAKYLGAKDPSQLQQSLSQRSMALGASLTRPGCASSQCRHRPEPFVRSQRDVAAATTLSLFLPGWTIRQHRQQRQNQGGEMQYIFQLGSMGPKGRRADTSRPTPWREAEMPIFQ